MSNDTNTIKPHRARWAAIGAAVAVSLGAGGIGLVQATSPTGASAYVPITPCRLADTRPAPNNVGPKSTPVGSGQTHTFNGWASAGGTGDCDATDLPDGTTGLELNVTAVGPTQNTNVRFWPTDETMPLSSNLNPSVGQPATPNSVSVTLSPTGQFDVFNFQGNVDVVIDVVGHYTDHDHDDRYYTKTEVDDLLAPFVNFVAASAAGEQNLALQGGTDLVARSVSLMPPADGLVLVNSSNDADQTGATVLGARCSITTDTATEGDHLQISWVEVNQQQTMSGTRGFTVSEGVLFTVNLVCDAFTGDGTIRDSSLTAIFAPS